MSRANVLSGALGGIVVLVIGAVLIATNVIETGDTTKEIVQQPISQPTSQASSKEGRTVSDIYKQEGKGVVYVQARGVSDESSPFGLPGSQQGTATGSGFVVDKDGTILTNAHVVEGASSVTVSFDENGGDAIKADVKGLDTSSDLAVLKVDPDKVKDVLPLGDSSKVQVGDPVVAIGNPFGFTRTVTTGIVSALQRQITAPNGFPIRNVIQTDAAINPGNSGGPLLDSQGRVIGINSQIATGGQSNGSVGIGFAIPINTAKSLLPRLEKGGKIERAYLGVSNRTPSDRSGAIVDTLVPGAPAQQAGLQPGDKIVQIDDKRIASSEDVSAAVTERKPGEQAKVTVERGGDRRTLTVNLGTRPETGG
jgi:S1-C subfamily serine protease